jgi:predicted nucleic acid-binding Zn ribbon protein
MNVVVVHIRLIITSIKRQCQLNSTQYLMIYFFYWSIKDRSHAFYRLSKIRSTCLYLSFFSCSEQCQRYIAMNTITKEKKRRRRKESSCLFLLHLSRLLLVQVCSIRRYIWSFVSFTLTYQLSSTYLNRTHLYL